jgi:serine protease
VNLTAVRPDGTGYLTAFDGASDPTTTSTLNYRAGTTVPNVAIIPTSTCTASACSGSPQISIYNGSLTPTDVVVDLVGVYVAAGTYGLRFHPFAAPSRIVDTRSGIGRPALGVGMARQFWLPSQIADGDTQALLANVTAVKPTSDTYLTVSDSPLPHPATSTLNAPAGVTVANAAPIPLSGQWFFLYNNAGLSNAVVDVSGSFENAPGGTPFLARRAHDAHTDLSSVIGPVKHPKPGPPTRWNG